MTIFGIYPANFGSYILGGAALGTPSYPLYLDRKILNSYGYLYSQL